MLFSYDKTLGTVETSQGTMTLTKVFIPFFLEMFLMNFMQTVNTFMLSYFSDNAVAAVGAAGQFSSMIYTFLLRHWNGCLHCFMPSSWRRKKRTDLRSCIFSACLWCCPKCSY